MAKDPAFLFYPGDFLTGTMFMSNEDIGIYVRLLCAQHQHGGFISKDNFNSLSAGKYVIIKKFIEAEEGFFNERLMAEMHKREKKSSNLSKNAKIRWDKHRDAIASKNNANEYATHMPIEDRNRNRNNTLNTEKSIIGEMTKVWMELNPSYQLEENNDYPPLLNIAYKIAKIKGWQKSEVVNGKLEETAKSWQTVAKFIKGDDFYKKLELATIEKKWTGLIQTMSAAKEGSSKKEIDHTKIKIVR